MDMVLVLQGLTSHLTHYRSFRRRNNGTCPFKITIITSIWAIFIVQPKCTLVTANMPTGQTDRQMDGWTPDRYITLSARLG